MEQIPRQIIERAADKIDNLSDRDVQNLIEEMSKKIPLILSYLIEVSEDILDEDRQELLLYTSLIIWQTLKEGSALLPQITEKILGDLEIANFRLLGKLNRETKADVDKTIELFADTCHQGQLFQYAAEIMLTDEITTSNDDWKLILGTIKTIIDCFDRR